MIKTLLDAALRLDRWLHRKLGRPYGVALTVGLAIDLAHKIGETPARLAHVGRLAPLALVMLLNLALLIHQLAELGERTGKRPREGPDAA